MNLNEGKWIVDGAGLIRLFPEGNVPIRRNYDAVAAILQLGVPGVAKIVSERRLTRGAPRSHCARDPNPAVCINFLEHVEQTVLAFFMEHVDERLPLLRVRPLLDPDFDNSICARCRIAHVDRPRGHSEWQHELVTCTCLGRGP